MNGDMLGRTIVSEQLKLHLYVSGLWVKRNCPLHDMTDNQLRNFGLEGILANQEADERPIITSPTDNILTQNVITQLNVGVSFESKRENYGINNFFEAKEIIVLFT